MERLTADCCFCAFVWQDMEDDELRQVLIYGVGKAGLAFNDMADIDAVIALIAQKRRMPGFGNAGTVNSLVNFVFKVSELPVESYTFLLLLPMLLLK